MAVLTFDTHEIVKELTLAGFTEQQAEAVTRAVRRAQDVDLSHLATKIDLAETKVEILKWIIGAMGVQTLAILGGVAAMAKVFGSP